MHEVLTVVVRVMIQVRIVLFLEEIPLTAMHGIMINHRRWHGVISCCICAVVLAVAPGHKLLVLLDNPLGEFPARYTSAHWLGVHVVDR